MSLVYIGLGTNLGDKKNNLIDSINSLTNRVGEMQAQSSFFASKSWGYESENEFLNAVVLVETDLQPFELLKVTQEIESDLGRKIKSENAYADRIIDIDILFYDNNIINHPSLIIPHPLIAQRIFVLEPMSEIANDFIHPVLNSTIGEMKLEILD